MITEDYVSFETAKLLKEKGFDEITFTWYNGKGNFCVGKNNFDDYHMNHFSNMAIAKDKNKCSAPTLQMAMKWLREVHKILILVEYDCPVFSSDIYKMDDIDKYGSAKHIPPTFANCKNYEQACETAIKYCLENLI